MSQPYNWCSECNAHVTPVEGGNGLECPKCATIIAQTRPRSISRKEARRRVKADAAAVKSWAANLRSQLKGG